MNDFNEIYNNYNIKFCVFLGREKNLKILHSYIEYGIENRIITEYHMYNFSRNINDSIFISKEYDRLIQIYPNKIFIYNHVNFNNIKQDWSPFYKNISKSNENDIIIKCDDDILFIDMNELKNSIIDRINDKISFIIHSNCINNGVCSYYQRELFNNIKEPLNIYPKGGILGIIFEKPELAYIMHKQFTDDLLKDLNNIEKYFIKNEYITSRISINFILINGIDAIHLADITTDDEYEVSSYIPELLERPNKINGKLITSHLSYTFQDKIMQKRDDIYNNYLNIQKLYIKSLINLVKVKENYKENNLNNDYIPKSHIIDLYNDIDKIYKIKNWYTENNYYIKIHNSNKYLAIDYDTDQLYITDNIIDKTSFNIIFKNNNCVEIKLGIYNLTRYNSNSNIKNEIILMKYFRDDKEKEILLDDNNNNNDNNDNSFYIKFTKYNCYLTLKDNKVEIINNKNLAIKWSFEKIDIKDYYNCIRFIKNKKIYYKDIDTNQIYTNYYKGWSLENVLW
jgi:hypothetical protein